MAENLYYMGNGYSALTKLTGSVSTNLVAATSVVGAFQPLLQLSTPSTRQISLVEYGISMSGSPAGAELLLISTNAACATTGAVAGIIAPYTNTGGVPTALCTSGTSNSCYYTAANAGSTGTVEGVYDQQLLTTNTYVKQFPLAREPIVNVSNFLTISVMVPTTAVNCFCYVIWRE